MAPNASQARKKKERNLVSPGRVGTRTGLTLPERPRDEYGLEDPKGLFDTSPATIKSTRSTRTTGRKSNGAIDSSESMDIADSSAPDPTETLTERRAANAKGRLTPAGKSPIKTPGLGPARRGSSIGPLSSPLRQSESLGQATQSPRRRLLDFTRPDAITGARQSAGKLQTPSKAATQTYGSASKGRLSVFDPIFSPARGEASVTGGIDDEDDENPMGLPEDEDSITHPLQDSALPPMDEDMVDDADQGEPVEDLPNSQLAQEQQVSSATKKKSRRSLRSSDMSQNANVATAEAEEAEPAAKPAGRPTKGTKSPQRKRGRPPKALAEKDGNVKPRNNNFVKPGVPFALQRQREETPFDDGQLHTKSGRASFKPLQYWKGERAVFVPNHRDDIQSIIRIDDVTPIKRKFNRARSPHKSRKRRKREYSVFEEEQDDDGEEPWELEEGVISGPVKLWNAELGVHEDEEQEQELAFASRRIETREADGANFLFAKTLTTPFFGSGIVELPPQGFKTLKNSRHFQMVFFVHYGKVVVEAATRKSGEATRFVITKGGMWQIPRGNFYSIANETDRPAKIFFAQGREQMVTPVERLDLKDLSK